jgi:Tfp pilus assembly protein PilV
MRPPRRRDQDRGESLVEILVSIAVIGIAVTGVAGGFGLLGAVGSGARSSRLHQDAVQGQAALRSWAQVLSRPADSSATSGYRYVPCSPPAGVPAASVPAGWTAQIATVSYWTGSGWSSTCGTDGGLQKLRLQVAAPSTGTAPAAAATMDVVIRRPCRDSSC